MSTAIKDNKEIKVGSMFIGKESNRVYILSSMRTLNSFGIYYPLFCVNDSVFCWEYTFDELRRDDSIELVYSPC